MRKNQARLGWVLVLSLLTACGGVVERVSPGGDCDSGGSGGSSPFVSTTASGGAGGPSAPTSPDNDPGNSGQWTPLGVSAANIDWPVNGAAFDGRYVYLAPGESGPMSRYDSQGDFASPASWTKFDLTQLNALAGGFRGATFDGRYVYFVPYDHGDGSLSGTVARYDTKSGFEEAASWSTFDVSSIAAGATGFLGGEFDGRYLYLVPLGIEGALSGVLVRYDTRETFCDRAAWSTFDTRQLSPNAEGFYGATFDGRYLYLSPYASPDGGYGSTVTRYDTQGALSDPGSWSLFDGATVDPLAKGFFGASFDGRYAYFVPYLGAGSNGGRLLRYDTQSDYSSPSSWLALDISALGIEPQGALFDGRYLYPVPGSGRLARLDTEQSITAAGSWSTFASPDPIHSFGGAFDGQYLYFFPSVGSAGTSVTRFETHPRTAMPSSYHGSFF